MSNTPIEPSPWQYEKHGDGYRIRITNEPDDVYIDMTPFASAAMFSSNLPLYFDGVTPLKAHMESVLRKFNAAAKAEKQDGMNRAQRRARKGKR